MKNILFIYLISSLIVINTIKTFAAVEYANDSLVFKHEISLDISYVFQEFLRGEGGISMYSNNYWTPLGLSYKILNKNNNAIGVSLAYRYINGGNPPMLIDVNDTFKTFLHVSHRKNNLDLNISYEFRKKIKRVEIFYGASLYGHRNYNESHIRKDYYYGNDYLMSQPSQLVLDTSYSEQLSSVSYRMGINLNTGIRFSISNHFSFITSFGLPLFYEFGEGVNFNIYSQKLEKLSYNYYTLAGVIQGRFSIAYLF